MRTEELPTANCQLPIANWQGEDDRPAADLRRRAVRGGTLLIASRLLIQVGQWAVTLIVARLLVPYDYGLMTSGLIFVGLADLLAEAGVGRALIQKDKLEPGDLAEGFTVTLLLAAALYGLLYLGAPHAAAFLDAPEFSTFLRVLALILLLLPFKTIPLALLDRNLKLGSQSGVYVATAVVQSGLVLGLAAAGLGYWALLAGVLAARLSETVAFGYLAGWRPRLRWPGPRARGLLAFGLHVSLGSLLWFVYSNSDFAIVGKLAGPVALGYYALAFQLISLPVQKLTANVNQVAYPVYCRLQQDPARLRDWYLRLTGLLGFFGLPVLVGMVLVADDAFLVVFGTQWTPAVLPFQLLSGAGLVMLLSASLPPLLNALGRPDLNLKYTALCTLVFPACFVPAGLAYGLIGICVVWVVVYPLMVAGLFTWTKPLTGVGLTRLLRVQAPMLGAGAFMTLVVLAVRWGLEVEPPLRLGLSVVAGALAYAGWMVFLARRTVLADLRALWCELRR